MRITDLYALLIAAALFTSGCARNEEQKNTQTVKKDSTVQPVQEPIKITALNKITTKTGKVFSVTVNKHGESLADILVSGQGFAFKQDTLKFLKSNPFEKAFLADLDANGFEELYIITRTAGSGSYGEILGIVSNNDKSYSVISVEEIKEKDMKQGMMFEGYMGSDSIYVYNSKLVREFPVYKPKDKNNNPTGGKRKVYYKLTAGQTSFLLNISGKEDLK